MSDDGNLPIHEIKDRYLRYLARYEAGKPSLDEVLSFPEEFAAWTYVEKLIADSPQAAWTLILSLLNAAPDEAILCNIAAGHLEDLIKEHGQCLLPVIREEAWINERVRRALHIVRVTNTYPCFTMFESIRDDLQREFGESGSNCNDPDHNKF